jgi:hypothetical protein
MSRIATKLVGSFQENIDTNLDSRRRMADGNFLSLKSSNSSRSLIKKSYVAN